MATGRNLPTYQQFVVSEEPDLATKWEEWLEGFEAMTNAMQVTDKQEEGGLLIYYAGAAVRKIIKIIPEVDINSNFTDLKTALNKYFTPKLNRCYGMNTLHQIKQKQGEPIDSFCLRVKEKVAAINLEALAKQDLINLVILSHMVNSCVDKSVKHKAIRDDLNLEAFMKTARAAERADYQIKDMEAETVNRVGRTRIAGKQYGAQRKRSKSRKP